MRWLLVFLQSLSMRGALQVAGGVVWVFCAIALRGAPRIWAWVGSLLAVCAIAVFFGAETLRLLSLVWRAEYGDRSIELDPSTIGIPLFCAGLFTVGSLLALAGLLSMPAWPLKARDI